MPAGLTTRTLGQGRCRLMVAVFACLLLSACSFEHDQPFRVGSNIWAGYEPLYLARSLGEYDDSGIKLVELANASEVIQALRNGNLEAAALTLDEVLTIVQDGYDLKVIAVLDFSRGGDVLLARPDIGAVGELKGRRIGVENTAVGAIMLDAALQEAELMMSDVTMVALTLDEHLAAFTSGSVDAIVTFEPVRTQVMAAGGRPLFDSTAIPDRIVDVLVVAAAAVEKNNNRIKRLLEGYFHALRYLQENPQQATTMIAQRMAVPTEAVPAMYDGIYQPSAAENRVLLGGEKASLQAVLQRLETLMIKRGMLHRIPDTSGMLSAAWLPEPQ